MQITTVAGGGVWVIFFLIPLQSTENDTLDRFPLSELCAHVHVVR